ncbi:MAG: 50S ribosomal protein L9 [Chthoniobacterales bacterium]
MGFQQVILIEPVENLGSEADVVKVRRGFARNFLIPQNKAMEVTAGSLRRVNSLKARRAEREGREINEAEELGRKISKIKISITLETGETGKAFGSVTAKDIHDKIVAELGDIQIPRHAVTLEAPIKTKGEHEAQIKLHPQVTIPLKISVVTSQPEQAGDEAEKSKAKKTLKS